MSVPLQEESAQPASRDVPAPAGGTQPPALEAYLAAMHTAGRCVHESFEAALVHAERAVGLARTLGPLEAARALAMRSAIRNRLGDPDGALADADEGLDLHPLVPGCRGELLFCRGLVYSLAGEYEEAFEDFSAAMTAAAEEGDTAVARRTEFLLVSMFPFRNLDEGIERAQALLADWEDDDPAGEDHRGLLATRHARPMARAEIAVGLARVGRFEDALRELDHPDFARAGSPAQVLAESISLFARAALGEPTERVLERFDEILATADALGDRLFTLNARSLRAIVAGQAGGTEAAVAELREVTGELVKWPFQYLVVRSFLAEILLAAGDHEAALEVMEEVVDLERHLLEVGGDARIRALETVRALRDAGDGLDQQRSRLVNLVDLSEELERRVAQRTAELNNALGELRRVAEEYRLITENSAEVVARHLVDGTFVFVSPSVRRVVGLTPEELTRSTMETIVHPEDRLRTSLAFDRAIRSGRGVVEEVRLRRDDHTWFWAEVTLRPVTDRLGTVESVHSVIRDVSRRRAAEQELIVRTLHDPLTGLANRSALQLHLDELLSGAGGYDGGAGVLLLDLDRFGLVNDSRGHRVGDALLRQVAHRLSAELREGEFVARLGGDEFAVVLPSAGSAGDLRGRAEDFQSRVQQPWTHGGEAIVPAVSIGAASAGPHVTTEELLGDVDTALRRAKETGPGRIEMYGARLRLRADRRFETEAMIRRALAEDRLRLHLQPILHADSLKLAGAEALVRIDHPDRGLIGPPEFLEVAEESGLIGAIGEWVLERAVGLLHDWSAAGSDLPIAVNLGMRELLNPRTVEIVQGAGLPSGRLQIELTERTLVDAHGSVATAIGRLRELGVVVALDDFGTAHSSITYLRGLPVQIVKIDRSFVTDVAVDAAGAAVVSVIVNLARSLNCRTVAEGVETSQQLEAVRAIGCDLVQGFLLGRPAPAETFDPDGFIVPGVVDG